MMTNPIKLIPVNLGIKTVKIPIAEIKGKGPGRTLLITGGVDGDEYAGIEAAYRIINQYTGNNFNGKLIIIPILNIPGFEAVTSVNPLDGKYPKFIYPGKKTGSPSERLIAWLDENYLRDADVWLDMHGGAMTEELLPYVYLYETKNKDVNSIVYGLLKQMDAPKIVYGKPGVWKKVELLAKKRIVYILTEAGYGGDRSEVWINKHMGWAETVMGVLGMIQLRKNRNKIKPRVYRKLFHINAPFNGLWYPQIPGVIASPAEGGAWQSIKISKNQLVGKLCSYDKNRTINLTSPVEGEHLFWKRGIFCKKRETLVQIGYQKFEI